RGPPHRARRRGGGPGGGPRGGVRRAGAVPAAAGRTGGRRNPHDGHRWRRHGGRTRRKAGHPPGQRGRRGPLGGRNLNTLNGATAPDSSRNYLNRQVFVPHITKRTEFRRRLSSASVHTPFI